MAFLCGKGIWLAHSHDLQRAVEMATQIDGTHLLVKVGHGPIYFPEIARNMITRIRTLGFHPAAWLSITNHTPEQALKAIVESLEIGYEVVILRLGKAGLSGEQAKPLAKALDNVEIPRDRLYIASPPLKAMVDTQGMNVLVPFCQGGWMPLAFGNEGESARDLIDREIYQALGDLSLVWGKTPDVYPVLSSSYGTSEITYLAEEFSRWVDSIAQHGVDFFSIYHAANTQKALWSMINAVELTCRKEVPSAQLGNQKLGTHPQPVYIVSKTSDTVWGIITRHGLTKEQFWTWNAHLWEDRGLPRDPDYMQEGWRMRVK